MDAFISFMEMIIEFAKTPVNLWGFDTSLWNIFLYGMLGSLVFWFIGGLFND